MTGFESMLDDTDPRRSKGWFSRRQATSAGLIAYREDKQDRLHDWAATMAENRKARAKRSAAQQIALLDKRLGKGKGAVKERKRLWTKIDAKAKKAKKSK
jgi:hypothetical protein